MRGELGRLAVAQCTELAEQLRTSDRDAWQPTALSTAGCATAGVGTADREHDGHHHDNDHDRGGCGNRGAQAMPQPRRTTNRQTDPERPRITVVWTVLGCLE
jgi:hypothetical protein